MILRPPVFTCSGSSFPYTTLFRSDRRAFLDRFTEHSKGVGFAVLGGAFAEGIDLPGNRLIGAFIATLGLPQVNPVNEQFKARLEQLFSRGLGYDYPDL